jgi:hypothetical protein
MVILKQNVADVKEIKNTKTKVIEAIVTPLIVAIKTSLYFIEQLHYLTS